MRKPKLQKMRDRRYFILQVLVWGLDFKSLVADCSKNRPAFLLTLRLLNFVFQFLRFWLWRHHSPQPTSKKCRIQYSYPAVHSVSSCNTWCLYIFWSPPSKLQRIFHHIMGPNTNVQLAGTCPKQLAKKTNVKGGFQNDGVLNFSYFSPRMDLFVSRYPPRLEALLRKTTLSTGLDRIYVIFQDKNHWDVSPHPQMVNGNHQKNVENHKQQEPEIVLKRRLQGWDIHHGKSSSSCIGIQIRSFCPGIVQNRKPSGSQYV